MSFTPVLEVAISLALLYLFFSQVVSSGFELIASLSNARGRYLREWLNKALNSGRDKNWAELVYRHPTVDMLAKSANRPPPYVPSSVFAKAIADLVIDEVRQHRFVPVPDSNGQPTAEVVYHVADPTAEGQPPLTPLQQLRKGMEQISEGDFKALLRTTLLNAEGCSRTAGDPAESDAKVFDQFIHGLAVWYDNYMDRVGGWYKKHIRLPLFFLSLGVAVFCNLDSLRVAGYLWHHGDERRQIVEVAEKYLRDNPTGPGEAPSLRPDLKNAATAADTARAYWRAYGNRLDSLTGALQGAGFPIGWQWKAAAPAVDSSRLDSVFLVEVPARRVLRLAAAAVPKDSAEAAAPAGALAGAGPPVAKPVAWEKPAHYIRYERMRQRDTTDGLVLSRVVWKKTTLPIAAVQNAPQLSRLVRPPQQPAEMGFCQTLAAMWRQVTGWTVLGWLLTAAALSFGAPFWFELLNRFVNMRGIGLKPTTAQSDTAPATEPRRS